MEWIFEIENVVFSGGGVRGLVFVGAWGVLAHEYGLRDKNLYHQIRGYAGSSAGAFIALLASLGFTEKQMARECMLMDGVEVFRNMDLINLNEQWGLHNKKEVVTTLRKVLETATGNPDISFKDLFQRTGKELVVVVARVNDGTEKHLSYETTPDLEVWRAVVASMSIPVLFTPNRIGEEIWVDGGLLANLPLTVFPMEKSLAFLLTRTLPFKVANFRDYMMRILYLALDALERQQISSIPVDSQKRIIRLNTGDLQSVAFAISDQKKQETILLGASLMYRMLHPDVLVSAARHLVLQSLHDSLIK